MNNAYDIVMNNRKELVDKLIQQMQKGYVPTKDAWNDLLTNTPYNPVSQIKYRAGNRFRLMYAAIENGYTDPRWMTFKQAADNNYKILPGSKSVLLEKWIFHKDIPRLDEHNKPVLDDITGKPIIDHVPYAHPRVNYFRVFNAAHISGLPELTLPEVTHDQIFQMETDFVASSKCPIYYDSSKAFYSPAEDAVHLPPKEAFKSNESRLSVLLHEMSHSTGHESRLNRNIRNSFGSIDYAIEELNAEISSFFLESDLGIHLEVDTEIMADHANYLNSWLSVLKNDPNAFFRACAAADNISSYLYENYQHTLELNLSHAPLHSNSYQESLNAELKRNHFRPTTPVLRSIQELNSLTGKKHSLQDIHSMYKNDAYPADSQEGKLVKCIGDNLKLQELQHQVVLDVGMEI